MSQDIVKTVSKKLKYYFEVKRLEDGFDLSGPECPRLDHPPTKARPTLMYDGLHDRPLKHYFRHEARTGLTQFKADKGAGKEKEVKKMVEKYLKKYHFVQSALTSSYYYKDKRGRPRLNPGVQGFGIPMQKSKRAHSGGNPVLRCVPSQYVTHGEAVRLINMASKLLAATGSIDVNEKEKNDQQRQNKQQDKRPQSAPKSYESDGGERLPAIENKKRPQTAAGKGQRKDKKDHKMYKVSPDGKKVFVKYNDGNRGQKGRKRDDDREDSAYSTRPGSTSPKDIYTIEGEPAEDEEVKPWLRREIRRSSSPGTTDDERSHHPPSTPEPHPPRGERPMSAKGYRRPLVEQASPRDRSHSNVSLSSTNSSHSSSSSASSERRHHDTRQTQTGAQLMKDYEPSEKIIYHGKMIKYRVHVFTGEKIGAATRADIRIALVGDKGRTEEVTLRDSKTHKVMFQKGQEDVFDLDCYFAGPLRKIFIGHDRQEMGTDWYLERVLVKDLEHHYQYEIGCRDWLSARSGDKSTFKDFRVQTSCTFSPEREEKREQSYGDRPETHIAIVHTSAKVEQVSDDDEHKYQPKATRGTDRNSSTETTCEESKRTTISSNMGDTSTTFTSEDSRSQRQEDKKAVVTPRGPAPRRRDDFFDQQVRDKDYTSVIDSLSVTTEQKNQDDFGTHRSQEPVSKDTRMTVTPVPQAQYSRNESANWSDPEPDAHESAVRRRPEQDSKHEQKAAVVAPRVVTKEMVHEAASTGNLELLKVCLEDRPDYKTAKDGQGWNLLHVAVDKGHSNVVQWLTTQMSDLDDETPTGNTVMHFAAMNGNLSCMRLLFDMGASVNCKSYTGHTPLHIAAENGELEVVKFLVDNKADVTIRDVLGRSPLDLAAESHYRGAEQCHNYLKQYLPWQPPKQTSAANQDKKTESTRSTSTVDSSSSSSYTTSSSDSTTPSTSTGRVDEHISDAELTEKEKKKHDEEIMEKRRLFDEQQVKMKEGNLSLMDSIRADLS